MQISEILASINEEISRLEQVRELLAGNSTGRTKRSLRAAMMSASDFPVEGAASASTPKKRRKLSAAGRARIAAAQKARWAKVKKANGSKESK